MQPWVHRAFSGLMRPWCNKAESAHFGVSTAYSLQQMKKYLYSCLVRNCHTTAAQV